MRLFLIGLIIGIGKVIPGVSGAMLAINFKVYDKLIKGICNLSNRDSRRFLFIIGSGIGIAIILGSKIILYLINNYYFIVMLFFIGLLINGISNFTKEISFNKKNIILLIGIFFGSLLLLNINIRNEYVLTNSYRDNIMMFMGGVIEIISSIIPGVSGTVLNMILGIYEIILLLISNIYKIYFVIENINLYIFYGIGMFITLVIMILFINKLINNYKNIFYILILGFSISSLLFLIINLPRYNNYRELGLGILMGVMGYIISNKLNRYN